MSSLCSRRRRFSSSTAASTSASCKSKRKNLLRARAQFRRLIASPPFFYLRHTHLGKPASDQPNTGLLKSSCFDDFRSRRSCSARHDAGRRVNYVPYDQTLAKLLQASGVHKGDGRDASRRRPAHTPQMHDNPRNGCAVCSAMGSRGEGNTRPHTFCSWNFSLSSATIAALNRSFWSRSPFDATSSARSSVSLASSCRRAARQPLRGRSFQGAAFMYPTQEQHSNEGAKTCLPNQARSTN